MRAPAFFEQGRQDVVHTVGPVWRTSKDRVDGLAMGHARGTKWLHGASHSQSEAEPAAAGEVSGEHLVTQVGASAGLGGFAIR